jgi:hypothetical protein
MSSPTGAFSPLLVSRGVDLAALGVAYLAFLASGLLAAGGFVAARQYLVISPNRWTRDYGIHASWLLATLLIAIVLENELTKAGAATTHYVAMPQLLVLLGLHAWIWNRRDPWLVALGAAAAAATVVVMAVMELAGILHGLAYGLTGLMLTALLALLWRQAVSTKRGFVTASSIYIGSKETPDTATKPQTPWLGLAQWAALIAASVVLAVCNALLRGAALEEIPATEVATGSLLQISVTAGVSAVPAVAYWLTRKSWMPELTRFVWLAWMVVGFAFTYGNYLSRFV